MATAAFRSSGRRSSGIGAAEPPRRARSLSRYSGRCPPPEPPRGRFVNTERGSQLPEVSLEELASEFASGMGWGPEEERGRARRVSDAGFAMETESSRRRGRSVSRKGGGAGKAPPEDGAGRRRRSVSVVRHQRDDPEGQGETELYHSLSKGSNIEHLGDTNCSHQLSLKSNASNFVSRKASSKHDLQISHDCGSSQSSSVTDDECRGVYSDGTGSIKKTRAAHGQDRNEQTVFGRSGTGLYDAMRKEVRHAVEDIRVELTKVLEKTKPSILTADDDFQKESSDAIKTIAEIRKSYTLKLEESEKRKQQLLAELAEEEQRALELSKIIKELLPDGNPNVKQEKSSRARRRSNEKTRASRRLTEEAEKYFEEFIMNIEDTDFSSFDGERSDTSSSLGGVKFTDSPMNAAFTESPHGLPTKAAATPVESDGILLPWLQWGTVNDSSLLPKTMVSAASTPTNNLRQLEASPSSSHHIRSSRGSCGGPDLNDASVVSKVRQNSYFGEITDYMNKFPKNGEMVHSFKMNGHLSLVENEETSFEAFRQRKRVESGGLILCSASLCRSYLL